ncbi:MAG: copper-containing nitrite reductase [Halobacteriales archaeon]
MFDTTRRRVLQALGISGATATVAGCANAPDADSQSSPTATQTASSAQAQQVDIDQIGADPTDIPDPVTHSSPKTHDITLEVEEMTAEIEPGVTFDFMTFGGQVPGPMIRVRQGDTVNLTMKNLDANSMQHNVDFHAVYGTGGGAIATTAAPGEANGMKFQAKYPGAYIYHCAVPNLDYHISAGMFGMIVVEPKEGLPEVDREFYFGQHEIYTDKSAGEEGHHGFDMQAMKREDPTYVVLNGEKHGFAAARNGPLEAELGETIRVFLVDGGPNLSSNFHPIGNVWSRAYRDGAITGPTERNIQTMKVPPGSCMIGEMETPVPERIKLVDHALSRVVRKGMLAEIDVKGEKQPDIFDPSPDLDASEDEEGPLY